MRGLFLALGSYRVPDTTGVDADSFDRQLLYAVSLNQLCKIVPKDFGILTVDNTVSGKNELHKHLSDALSLPQVTATLFSQNNSLGSRNKGAGEYGMCRFAHDYARDLFGQTDWVIYYTMRHVMSFPLIFGHLERYSAYDAIVSNAPFLYPDRPQNRPDRGVFHDLIFAMKRETFIKYIESLEPELMVRKRIGSEQNLYDFLVNGHVNFKQVERFGVLRYDYMADLMQVL